MICGSASGDSLLERLHVELLRQALLPKLPHNLDIERNKKRITCFVYAYLANYYSSDESYYKFLKKVDKLSYRECTFEINQWIKETNSNQNSKPLSLTISLKNLQTISGIFRNLTSLNTIIYLGINNLDSFKSPDLPFVNKRYFSSFPNLRELVDLSNTSCSDAVYDADEESDWTSHDDDTDSGYDADQESDCASKSDSTKNQFNPLYSCIIN